MVITKRIDELRGLMKEKGISAYLVPTADPHQSEYVPEAWRRRVWISGFTGSAGDIVITLDGAGLWTDSRYFLQAEKELNGTGIDLFRLGQPDVPEPIPWIADNLKPGESVGADPRVIAQGKAEEMFQILFPKEINVEWLEHNLIDILWKDRPPLSKAPVASQSLDFSGETAESKIERLREEMRKENVKFHVITMLDAIAWLFNIRGQDVAYNPVAVSYAIISEQDSKLFIDINKVPPPIRKHLQRFARILPYEELKNHLLQHAENQDKAWLDPTSVSHWIDDAVEPACDVVYRRSPVTFFKSKKNETEIAGFRNCHVKDGVAMVRFLSWLTRTVPADGVTEITAAERLEALREEQDLYRGPSFAAISAFAEHGAIVHYRSNPETDVKLKPEGLYLIDSGGQYLDGTTDITRTVALGPPTPEQRDRFTRVLQGHFAVACATFPSGTKGIQLDTLARKPLWDMGLQYGHGTGHGIGSYLNVHEGPQALSYFTGIDVPLEKGMFLSIEPGFYKAGDYGIRIENLAYIKQSKEQSTGKQEFYRFETVTLCPIDLSLVNPALLTDDEIGYLNRYHERVQSTLSPFLSGEDLRFLEEACQLLHKNVSA